METFDLLAVPHLKKDVLRSITSNCITYIRFLSYVICHYSGVWGTVCDDSFNDTDAMVVCRQLGHSPSNARARLNAFYGQGIGTTWLDNVGCDGSEPRLSGCSHGGWGSGTCVHSDDVGVACGK